MLEIALTMLAVGCLGAVVYSYALYPGLLVAVAALAQGIRDIRYVLGKRERRNPGGGERRCGTRCRTRTCPR